MDENKCALISLAVWQIELSPDWTTVAEAITRQSLGNKHIQTKNGIHNFQIEYKRKRTDLCVARGSLPHYIAIVGTAKAQMLMTIERMHANSPSIEARTHLVIAVCLLSKAMYAILCVTISYHVEWSRASSRARSSNPTRQYCPQPIPRTTHAEPIFHHLSMNGEIIAYCRFGSDNG